MENLENQSLSTVNGGLIAGHASSSVTIRQSVINTNNFLSDANRLAEIIIKRFKLSQGLKNSLANDIFKKLVDSNKKKAEVVFQIHRFINDPESSTVTVTVV